MFNFKFYVRKNKLQEYDCFYIEATGDEIAIDEKSDTIFFYSNLNPNNPDTLNLKDFYYVNINHYSFFTMDEFLNCYKNYVNSKKALENRVSYSAYDEIDKVSIFYIFEHLNTNLEEEIINTEHGKNNTNKQVKKISKKITKELNDKNIIDSFDKNIINEEENSNDTNNNDEIKSTEDEYHKKYSN